VIADTELEAWRQEWREQPSALPELKRKIRRQNARTIAAVVAICTLLIASAIVAVLYHSSLVTGFACGLAFAGVTLGAYGWYVQRGAWKPTAQTTLAYAELAHRRAVGKVKVVRAAQVLLLAVILAGVALIAWSWHHVHVRDWVILAALIAEMFFLRNRERRQKSAVVESKKLLDDLTGDISE